ncbi:MAG TPA: aspartate/tyrosine/aromatic aminotransferase [Candidatus Hydrogenedentes bacterium]|nr:aspartate/tyrosine/aromatic aminotransferase [Candidatus Hydrogenedentota bacterium]
MFEQLEMAPADAILGLTEAFKRDTTPNKINLGVGVYKDAGGKTPVLESVRLAQERILAAEKTKSYLPIIGDVEYGRLTRALLLGPANDIDAQKRASTAHTPGGTGALRVAADFLRRCHDKATVWISDPTWANHPAIFDAAGAETKTYPYYDTESKSIAFDDMLEALEGAPRGDVVLLHACCHNPSGVDLSLEQWRALAKLMKARELLPLVDFAYQGFGDGLDEDAAGLRILADGVDELLICSSYSKNFGLYRERCGALTVVGNSEDSAARAMSHVEKVIRANYSNPPALGGLIVAEILSDPDLRDLWQGEVAAMRERINGMRALFVDSLKAAGVAQDFSFIKEQRGMFSFSGLTRDQVAVLRLKHAIYIVSSGRINVAGMTESNMKTLCAAIAEVLQ